MTGMLSQLGLCRATIVFLDRTLIIILTPYESIKVEGVVQYEKHLTQGDFFTGSIGKARLIQPAFQASSAPSLGGSLEHLGNDWTSVGVNDDVLYAIERSVHVTERCHARPPAHLALSSNPAFDVDASVVIL